MTTNYEAASNYCTGAKDVLYPQSQEFMFCLETFQLSSFSLFMCFLTKVKPTKTFWNMLNCFLSERLMRMKEPV